MATPFENPPAGKDEDDLAGALRAALKNKGKNDDEINMILKVLGDDRGPGQKRMPENLHLLGVSLDTLNKAPKSVREVMGPVLSTQIAHCHTGGNGRRAKSPFLVSTT